MLACHCSCLGAGALKYIYAFDYVSAASAHTSAKYLLRSLKTSIPVVKLANADPVLREYPLYTLLSIVNEMGKSILTPQGLQTRELTAEEWHQ